NARCGARISDYGSPGFESDILRGNSLPLRAATSRIIAYRLVVRRHSYTHLRRLTDSPILAHFLWNVNDFFKKTLYKMQKFFARFLTTISGVPGRKTH
ncbi:MAG: hypothetical protein IJT04_02680, partial [Bacteroidales bacterium]|nr:hypothetical protein [Bacteroidales bacterium]